MRRAQNPAYPDERLFSAEEAILDQMGNKEEAHAMYRKALQIQPNEWSVMSNIGMSYLLSGDLKTAENYFTQAAGAPGADRHRRPECR